MDTPVTGLYKYLCEMGGSTPILYGVAETTLQRSLPDLPRTQTKGIKEVHWRVQNVIVSAQVIGEPEKILV